MQVLNSSRLKPVYIPKTFSPSNNRLLTQIEAAQLLGIAPNTLAVWRCNKRGGPSYIKVGRNVRYSLYALEQYKASHTIDVDEVAP